MLLDLPDVCLMKVLSFVDEKALVAIELTHSKLRSTIKMNRNQLPQRTFSSLSMGMSLLDAEPIDAVYELEIIKSYYNRDLQSREHRKTLRVINHNSAIVKPLGLRFHDDITERAAFLDDERVYEVICDELQVVNVFANDVHYSLQERMREEFRNSHIESLRLNRAHFSKKGEERLLSLFRIHKLTVSRLVLCDPTFDDEYDMMPLIRFLRHLAAPDLKICSGGRANIQKILSTELIEFLPSLRTFDNSRLCCHGSWKIHIQSAKEMEIPVIAPTTALPDSIRISVKNFRQIIQDWFYGRSKLRQLVVSISNGDMPLLHLAESLDVPHKSINLDDELTEILIESTTGELCTIYKMYFHRWGVRVGEEFDDDEEFY